MNIFRALMVVTLVTGSWGHAYPVTSADRIVAEAYLEARGSHRLSYPRPHHLAMIADWDWGSIRSFDLSEDTGVRCVVSSCSNHVKSRFAVTATERQQDGSVAYLASQISAEFELHRQFDRQIVVVDHSSRLNGDHQDVWEVRLTDFLGTRTYGGTPKSSYTDDL